jgi:Zn finger protein HypA/HybF involved in hydrogenase expression
MTQLTADERLAKVKTALGIGGDYQNETLRFYIDEVISELIAAGVKKEVAESAAAVGCIACGVNDLWNYTSGGVKHSEYFNRRLIQLSLCEVGENVSTE